MRRVNGSGTVYKLNDVARRRPWVAAVSYRDEEGFRHQHVVGYFETKKEAVSGLEAYNVNPYRLDTKGMTFAACYELWREEAALRLTKGTMTAYASAFNACAPLHDRAMLDLHGADLQRFLNTCGRKHSALHSMRCLWGLMWKFALRNEVVLRDATVGLTLPRPVEEEDRRPRRPYTPEEIRLLWEHAGNDTYAFELLMIYSGARIGELLALTPEDVDIPGRSFRIRHAKTKAGVRTVPIAEKTVPLWERLLKPGKRLFYEGGCRDDYRYNQARNIILRDNAALGIDHLPHDCRHTTITLLTDAGVDPLLIKRIVGHKSGNVTEDIYTHVTFERLLEAVNRI